MARTAFKANIDVATRRRIIFGSTLGASALLVLALVVIVNYLGFRHYQRWDWTRTHLYTLSEKSLSILQKLDREVSVIVFMDDQSPVFQPTLELLSRYAAASPKIHVSVVDRCATRRGAAAGAEVPGGARRGGFESGPTSGW